MRRPLPHARQEGQASSVTRPLEGRQETKKARSVVASSRVHSWRTSVSRSPPTAGLGVGSMTPAAVRPLVRMPTDRHAATGTCELGERTLTQSRPKIQDPNLPAREIPFGFFARHRRVRVARQICAQALPPDGCFARWIADKK